MAGAWPLTGRAEELRFIDAAVGRAGRAGGVVLAGAPGVGKTRLAREALAGARRRGRATRWAAATTSSRALPLGAFATLLAGRADQANHPLAALEAALLAGTGPAGVVIGVDDAHLLDELSALLVHQLVLQETATVVMTVRTGEPAPDAITALWKDGHADRIEVQPLSRAQAAELLRAALDGPVDTGAADRLWALTRGNALYLRHLVDGERDAGRLRPVRGVWCWPDPPALTPGLAELVEARIGELDDTLGEILDLLALAEPLDLAVLTHLCSPTALEKAEAGGLIGTTSGERGLQARLVHPLYGEVRRARLGRLRARRLRGHLAAALAATGAPGELLRRSVLAVDSDLPPDPTLLADAAREALRLRDLPLAARLARAAVAAGGGFEPGLALAYALTWQSHGDEADQMLAELTGTVTDDRQRVQVTVARCGNLFWTLRRPAQAEAVLAAARAAVVDERARLPLTAMQAALHTSLGRHEQAIDCGQQALADDDLLPLAVLLAVYGMIGALGVLGRADQIAPLAARAYTASNASFDAAAVAYYVGDVHLDALRSAGYLHESDRVAAELHARYGQSPGHERLFGVALLGYAALGAGRLDTAAQRLREVDAGLDTDTTGVHTSCLVRLTQALAMTGNAADARSTLARLAAEQHPGMIYLDPEIMLTRAWVAAAEGAISEAIRLARDAAGLAAATGQPAHELLALHTATCFGDRDTATPLTDLAARVEGPRARIAAAHAAAFAGDDGPGLSTASRHLEDMGDLLAAADAAAQAATAHARHGRRADQVSAAARALHLAAACGDARTPALTAMAYPLSLTDREREIVTLAAAGLTNRQIAERIVVSVRTVEGHLYRAAAKLGTGDRTHFAALLHTD